MILRFPSQVANTECLLCISKLIVYSANWVSTVISTSVPRINELQPILELIIWCLCCILVWKQILDLYRLFVHFWNSPWGRKYFYLFRQWVVMGLQMDRQAFLRIYFPAHICLQILFFLCVMVPQFYQYFCPKNKDGLFDKICTNPIYCNSCAPLQAFCVLS